MKIPTARFRESHTAIPIAYSYWSVTTVQCIVVIAHVNDVLEMLIPYRIKKRLKPALITSETHRKYVMYCLAGAIPFCFQMTTLTGSSPNCAVLTMSRLYASGTRTPVVLPYRITDSLVDMLKKHHPIWINTHFNHPREITRSSQQALAKLADAGIPLGNQSVLLAGVNDCPRIIRALVHKLVMNRVRPYYLYQCDLSEGLSHFRTPVGKGIQIMESLIGHTSGLCVPTYVIDAPGGGGKIPVMPNYLISWSTNKVVLRNYEGVITTYKEPDSYEPIFCDRNCDECNLQLSLEGASERKALGIEKNSWRITTRPSP